MNIERALLTGIVLYLTGVGDGRNRPGEGGGGNFTGQLYQLENDVTHIH